MNRMDILVTLDQNYLPPLQVMLTSLHFSHPRDSLRVYLMHRDIPKKSLETLAAQCGQLGLELVPIQVDGTLFQTAPITKQYPQEMYYRLLAPHLLPQNLHRVLYLDPDILVINSLTPLWETELQGCLFAAASHKGKTELMNNLNQVRLGTECKYFNSGVLLIDLDAGRKEIVPEKIFAYTEEHSKELLLPDQDILNALYGHRTFELEDTFWNYDARYFNTYLLRSGGVCDLDWVLAHTAILHFCGKSKPWQPGYLRRFGILYKHYMQLTRRTGLYLEPTPVPAKAE